MMRLVITAVLAATLVASCGTGGELSELAADGRRLTQELGCTSCHSGPNGVGPDWEGAWGTTRLMTDGSTAVFDPGYVRSSLSDPASEVVDGYQAIMPAFSLSEVEIEAIIAFLEEAE